MLSSWFSVHICMTVFLETSHGVIWRPSLSKVLPLVHCYVNSKFRFLKCNVEIICPNDAFPCHWSITQWNADQIMSLIENIGSASGILLFEWQKQKQDFSGSLHSSCNSYLTCFCPIYLCTIITYSNISYQSDLFVCYTTALWLNINGAAFYPFTP